MPSIKTAAIPTIIAPIFRFTPTRISRLIPGFLPNPNRAERCADLRRILPPGMTTGRILIVDGDVRLAGVLLKLLTREGFQPAHVPNGAAALACLARRSLDLLIVDVTTPQMNGI